MLTLDNADTAWLAEKEDRVKLVSFTGSAKVGWELKAHSGRKRVLLELGGNAALIVHGDWPDLEEAGSARDNAWGVRVCRAIAHQRAARVCGAQGLPVISVEGCGAREAFGVGRSVG